jgi:hypothetical protein
MIDDNTISRLHAVDPEARAAVSDAPDEEKEEAEKVYSDDSENVSSGMRSSSFSDSGASGDGEGSSADELNAASPPEEKNYMEPSNNSILARPTPDSSAYGLTSCLYD